MGNSGRLRKENTILEKENGRGGWRGEVVDPALGQGSETWPSGVQERRELEQIFEEINKRGIRKRERETN